MFELYVCDTETTGTDFIKHSPIEITLFSMTTGQLKTWWLKPIDMDNIDPGALRVNGHKLEDITHQTSEGKLKYKDPNKVIVEIENWLAENDNSSAEQRILVGHNIYFDYYHSLYLWKKCGAEDSFPYGRRMIDTMNLEFIINHISSTTVDSYALSALCKKYGIKNEKAHTAEADTKATRDVFLKQLDFFKKNA